MLREAGQKGVEAARETLKNRMKTRKSHLKNRV
jgi:hypothetical protein